VNLDVLASFRRACVQVVGQEQPETIVWDGRRFVIRVRGEDTEGRQRFSCAHGIVHTFFIEAGTDTSRGRRLLDGRSEQEEELCDQGAAELLLPRDAFMSACPARPDMDDVLDLAEWFNASAEATALRVVTLSTVPAAMTVLEPKLKPVEIRQMARRQSQPTLPGLAAEVPIVPRLRVQKSLGHELPFIPKHKSIDDSTPLGDVRTDDRVDYVGETGLVPGRFRVSARRLPIRRDGVLIDRVVALLFDASAESQGRARKSG
jgi:Zn-dependent peptidase ImmA (M78 family)